MGEADPRAYRPRGGNPTGAFLRGQVVAVQANFCFVALEAPARGGQRALPLICPRRTRENGSGQGIHVGDWVALDAMDAQGNRGAIVKVAPRRNLLVRPAVANVSQILVVVSLREPGLDPLQLTRFLVTAEAAELPVLLVFTKTDLQPTETVRAWCGRAQGWGYPVHAISVLTGQGLEALRKDLSKPGISVLCGPSGVGKSSLLQRLRPDLDLRIGPVSGRLRRGRHTTRHVELFELTCGALVADTPGFNRPDLPADPSALAKAFPELDGTVGAGKCRFRNCLHLDDPGCAFGTHWDRYPLYRQCLEQMMDDQKKRGESPPLSHPLKGRRRSEQRERQELADEFRIPPSRED